MFWHRIWRIFAYPVSMSRFTQAVLCLQFEILFPFSVSHPYTLPFFTAYSIYINNKRFNCTEITNLSTKRYKLWWGTRQSPPNITSIYFSSIWFRLAQMTVWVCVLVNVNCFCFRLIIRIGMKCARSYARINVTCEMSANCVDSKESECFERGSKATNAKVFYLEKM